MHRSALSNAARFFDAYPMEGATVVDIGAQDVNGSIRQVCPHAYVGVDFVPGPGVEIILDDPYKLPFADGSQDIIVASSCFEHSEFFWLLFLEIIRVLKPHGLFYLNVPSNGMVHRYPVDCWRFYPDAGQALVRWAEREGYSPKLLEHYTADREDGMWNDYIAVFVKDAAEADRYPNRITQSYDAFRNGAEGLKESPWPQDQSGPIWVVRRFVDRVRRRLGQLP
jgi:SAM-dependent methyltransferase